MGSGGTLEYLSSLPSSGDGHKIEKNETLQTVELKVMIDCDGCERKIKKALSSLKGVKSMVINRKQQKVTVSGYVDAQKVLKKVKPTGKKAEICHCVHHSAETYEKKAIPGYVRRIETTGTSTMEDQEDLYLDMFSEENPNSCSIM